MKSWLFLAVSLSCSWQAHAREGRAGHATAAIERRMIMQIVLPDEAEALRFAEAVRSGVSSSDAAARYGYTSRDLMAGERSEEEFAKLTSPAFARQVFTARPGSVVGPVKTILGWHVVQPYIVVKSNSPWTEITDHAEVNFETLKRIGDQRRIWIRYTHKAKPSVIKQLLAYEAIDCADYKSITVSGKWYQNNQYTGGLVTVSEMDIYKLMEPIAPDTAIYHIAKIVCKLDGEPVRR